MKFTLLSFLFVVVFGFTATAQSAKSAPLKVFPNPTTDVLNIKTSKFENVGYTLYDAQGKLVMQNILVCQITS